MEEIKMSKKEITRRDSLKRIAVTAYAVPTTMALLTSTRAVAQSAACPSPCENRAFTITHVFTGVTVTGSWTNCAGQNINAQIPPTGPGGTPPSGNAACGTQVTVSGGPPGPVSFDVDVNVANNNFVYN